MCSFISRPSEPRTVLLWGSAWWLPGFGERIAFADLAQAAGVLAEHFATEPKPVRLRLIYQPAALASVVVACPHGDRNVLAAALAGEFPLLAESGVAWGHEPVLSKDGGYTTVLHYETEPALIALATELARLGLAVDSAWPLATFLHALPDEWTDSGAITVLAVQSEAALAYRHPSDGSRTVEIWHSNSCVVEAGQWLGEILAANAEEPVLIVTATDEIGAALSSYLGDDASPNLEWIRLADALGRRVVLPRYHPAQLLPRPPAITAQRMAIAASIALFIAAGVAGVCYAREWKAVNAEMSARSGDVATLRAEVAHLRENAVEIAALRSLVEGSAAGSPCGAWLRQLARTVPAEIVLSEVRIDRRRFEVRGWTAPTASDGLLESWRGRFAPEDAGWSATVRTEADGGFTLTGRFRS